MYQPCNNFVTTLSMHDMICIPYSDMIVYKEGDSIYHSKILTFYRNEPFDLYAKYQFADLIPYPDPNIG